MKAAPALPSGALTGLSNAAVEELTKNWVQVRHASSPTYTD